MADPVSGNMNGFGHGDHATSPSAVQAEFERRARAMHHGFGTTAAGDPITQTGTTRPGPRQVWRDAEPAAADADAQARAASTVASFKDQAAEAAFEAKVTVQSLAEEARLRFVDLARQQKAAGADKLAGVARAVDNAAGDLDKTSPEMAKLVRSAAAGAERLAEDLKSRDFDALLGSIADLGRRRPLAFFAGAVLAGFALARFLKADPRPSSAPVPYSPRGDI